MSLHSHYLLATFALASILTTGCTPFTKSSKSQPNTGIKSPCAAAANPREERANLVDDSSTEEDAARAGVLAIGNAMIEDLCDEIQTTHDGTLVAIIAEGASNELNTAVGSLVITIDSGLAAKSAYSTFVKGPFSSLTRAQASISAPPLVAGPIVRGAFLSLTDPRASLFAIEKRVALAKRILSGTSAALNGRVSDLTIDETLDVMSGMTNTAVKSLPAANMAGKNSKESVSAVTMSAVGALPRAGIESTEIGSGAQKLAEGAVAALSTPGFDSSSLGSLSGDIAGSAIQGLGAAGLSAENIIQAGAIDLIISGAASGLKKNDASTASAMSAMGSIAGAAVSVLGKVGLNTPEMRKDALAAVVKSSMSGAQSLAANSNDSLAAAMSAVANQTVLALSSGGFEADQIGSALSVIVQTGISEIGKSGITNAAFATDIASKLIEGALIGAGTLMKTGTLDATQGTDAALSASTGAVKGLESLQTAGIVTGDAVTTFTSTITESVSSGLQQGGATADVLANAQTTVNTMLESDAVQGSIQANAGAAESVATPSISIATGTYNNELSVTLSTATASASIRYTVDGTEPTSSHGTLYSGAISISSSKTLKAIAYKTGWDNSQISSATYTLNIPTFATATTVTTGLNPEEIAAGDLNGDGKIDLAVALYNGEGVSILLGNGNGTFAAKQDFSSSPNSLGTYSNIKSAMIAVDDISGDSKPDIVWGAWGQNFLSYLTNTTSTNASTVTVANNMPTTSNTGVSGPRGVAIADVDGDDGKDIFIGEANGNKLIIYLHQSGNPGTFVKFGTNFIFNPDSSVYTGNAHPWMIALGDFNNDNKPDVVGGGGFGGILGVLLNNTTVTGTPAFQTANRINTNTALGCTNNSTVSVSDFNGDGRLDVVASCPTTGLDKVAVFISTTNNNATAASFNVSSFDSVEGIKAVASGDVTGDGNADVVVVADGSPDTLYLYSGNGDGTFDSAESFAIGTGTGPSKVILFDINGDSRLDAMVSNATSNQVTIFLNQSTGY